MDDRLSDERGALGEEIARTPGLKLAAFVLSANQRLVFVEQWKPESAWADRRVRLAANLAIDRKAINQAETLGHSRPYRSGCRAISRRSPDRCRRR